jgi:hypothetical protein
VGGACGTYGRREKPEQRFVGKPEGRGPLERPRRNWDSGIKMTLWILFGGCGLDSPGSG